MEASKMIDTELTYQNFPGEWPESFIPLSRAVFSNFGKKKKPFPSLLHPLPYTFLGTEIIYPPLSDVKYFNEQLIT